MDSSRPGLGGPGFPSFITSPIFSLCRSAGVAEEVTTPNPGSCGGGEGDGSAVCAELAVADSVTGSVECIGCGWSGSGSPILDRQEGVSSEFVDHILDNVYVLLSSLACFAPTPLVGSTVAMHFQPMADLL